MLKLHDIHVKTIIIMALSLKFKLNSQDFLPTITEAPSEPSPVRLSVDILSQPGICLVHQLLFLPFHLKVLPFQEMMSSPIKKYSVHTGL